MKIIKNKKLMRKITIAFAGTLLLTTVVQATSLTKKIDATFRGIKVYYNNQQKTMEQEPFIYNGSVYLPVRAVGELVDKQIDWMSATNSVMVSDKGTPVGDLAVELTTKNFEISRLSAEKQVLENKVKELEATIKKVEEKEKEKEKDTITSGDLKKTLSYIETVFDYKHSIDWDFKLTESNSRINIDISFDSRYDDKKWENLTLAQREGFFRDIAKEIRIDFRDTLINGSVTDKRTDKNIATFSYSKNNTFSYTDDSPASFTLLEKDLKRLVTTVDGTSIPVDDIILKGTEDNITFTVYIDLYNRTLQNTWAYGLEDNPREIRQVMEYIQEEILRDFRYASVQGFIEDIDSGSTLAKFDGKRLY